MYEVDPDATPYDYLGRMIDRSVWKFGPVPGEIYLAEQIVSETRYVYDGWNLLAELDATGNVLRTYGWGITDGGSFNNAGASTPVVVQSYQGTTGTYYMAPDVVGNIVGLFNTVDGTQSASFAYGPFGEQLRSSGPAASVSPFGYAGKYADSRTGWVYYGHRFYSPSLGRWLSRDPIEEAGGVNLYGFVGNDPINQQDLLGLSFFDSTAFLWGYTARMAYDSLMIPADVLQGLVGAGRILIHPPANPTWAQITCLLGDKKDEYLHASPEEQGSMFADAVFGVATLFVGGEAVDLAKVRKFERDWFVRCFPRGTKVETPNGKVSIEDIKKGDVVFARDAEGNIVAKKVTQLFRNATGHWVSSPLKNSENFVT